MTTLLETMVARWSEPEARPLFKGLLIDDEGCCCAQGDVLRMCGWTDSKLRGMGQTEADREVARQLGISVVHSILLRQINDKNDGCPQDVLAHPERILGDQAPRILAFWRKLDSLTSKQWEAAAGVWDAARALVEAAADEDAAWAAAGTAAGDPAGAAAWAAAAATNEIQGAAHLKSFHFLSLFGINDPSELDE